MGLSAPMNPYGGPLVIVDQLLGNAYEVVRFVARHMPILRQVSANMEALVTLANGSAAQPGVASGVPLLVPGLLYVPDTLTSAPTHALPPIANLAEGQFIGVADALGNAAANPITITVNGEDEISDHGHAATQHVVDNSNTITLYFKRNGLWRVIQYGG